MTRSYSAIFFWLGLSIAASLMLYHTSDRVHELDSELHSLNGQIEAERDSLHVLKAEWVYLANPVRIEAAAHRHLDLLPTAPRRVVALQDIGSLLPVRDGVEPPPVQLAQNVTAPAVAPVNAAAPSKAKAETPVIPMVSRRVDRVIAALNAGHINDHMTMQHSAAVGSATDKIGALIGTLGLNP